MGRDADPGRTTLKRDDRQHESARQLLVELVRFNLESFELEDQGVAALFGLELARLVVDTSQLELMAMQRER